MVQQKPPYFMEKKNNISLWAIFRSFLFVGAISFGGGIVAYLREMLVKNQKWLTDDEFMVILSIGQTMPGLNSVNVAILMGDKLRGVAGAVVAALGLMLPGSLLIMVLGIAYTSGGNHPTVNKLLTGVTAGAAALIAEVTWSLGRRSFVAINSCLLVVLTFGLMSIVKLSLPIVLLIVLPIGLFLYRPRGENK